MIVDVLFDTGSSADHSSIDPEAVVRLCAKNLAPVAAIDSPLINKLREHEAFATFYDRQSRRLTAIADAFAEVSSAWGDAEISSVLIKSPGYVPYTSSNLDVLVPADRAMDAERILLDLGFLELHQSREPYKRLYRCLRRPHWGFPIHVHTAVAWINRFIDGGDIMRGRREASHGNLSFGFAAPEHVFLITQAHWFYEDKELKLRDLFHLERSLRGDLDSDFMLKMAQQGGWRAGYALALDMARRAAATLEIPLLRQRLPSDPAPRPHLERVGERAVSGSPPFRLSKTLPKALQVQKTIADEELGPAGKAAEVGRVGWATVMVKGRSVRPGRSFVVTVSGIDGSGKTTLARLLEENLRTDFDFPARYHWMRSGSSPALDVLRKIAVRRGAVPKPTGSDIPTKEHLVGKPKLQSSWARAVAVDYVTRLWGAVLAARAHGGIHIFDRFTVDAKADLLAFYGVSLPETFWKSAPKVDFSILMNIDPAESSRRSSTPATDHYLSAVEPLYAAYGKNVDLVLDAAESPESLADQALRAVMLAFEGEG